MAKPHRFGKKQKRGSSRTVYFNARKSHIAAANKAARIAKDKRIKERAAKRKAKRQRAQRKAA